MACKLAYQGVDPCATGVDWCRLSVCEGLLALVREARLAERLVQAQGEPALSRHIRLIVADGVSAASSWAADDGLGTDEFLDRCFALRGAPYEEMHARRDMRERIRVLRRIARHGSAYPHTLDDMLGLWTQAMEGEMPLYNESELAQFRKDRIPFGHGKGPFERAEPPKGRETVDAARIPQETSALLAFMGRTDLPCEVVAAAAHFLCGHIHPFADGNGHLARMLSCILLSDSYSAATALALLRRLQEDRGTMNLAMARTVRDKDDLESVVRLFLEMLRAAQRDILPAEHGFVRLPLRRVSTEGLEPLSCHRSGREVYRMSSGPIVKMVAKRGRLSRACAVFQASSAAFEARAPIARPEELVSTQSGYAAIMDYVAGPSLGELVIQGKVSPESAGETMAGCLLALNAAHGDPARMRDVRVPFLAMVDTVVPWLSSETAETCRNAIRDIPPSTALVHGDVHMGNIIMGPDGTPTLIDADTISMGHPVFDLACTYSTLVCQGIVSPVRAESFHGVPCAATEIVWQSLLRRYLAATGEAHGKLLERRMELLAWLVLLNRLTATTDGRTPYGEAMIQKLQAAGRLAHAARRLKETCGW